MSGANPFMTSPQREELLERSVTVRTPEAIAFYYELAGLGSRFLAVLIDLIIQGTAFTLFFFGGVIAGARVMRLASAVHLNPKFIASSVFAIAILLAFALFYGYFVFFEKVWNGQTPGKRLLGIRVVRDGGYPVQLMDSIVRNLIRMLEFALGFYFISAICVLLSSENKRLGDYAAGTIVVRDRGLEVRDPKTWLRPGAFEFGLSPDGAFAKLSADELALVDRYAARKTSLTPQAARTTAAKIAAALRPKLDPAIAALPDEELLMKVISRSSN